MDGSGSDDEWVLDDEDQLQRRRAPTRLRDTLSAVAQQRRWGDRLEGAAVYGRWEQIVGEELARRCEPVRLAGGVLTVRAESTTWAAEVGYLVSRIQARADEVLRPGLVRDVKVVVGPLQGLASGTQPPADDDRR